MLEATQQTGKSVFVTITMRSDFLGDCSQFRGLAEAVGNLHKTDQARLNAIYQTLYNRPPTADETKWAMAYLKQTDKPWTLYHVLLCANEFLHLE